VFVWQLLEQFKKFGTDVSDLNAGSFLLLIEMVQRVEPLAHSKSLLDLDTDLLSSEGLQHDESDEGVETGKGTPDGEDAGAHGADEVSLLDVEEVGGGVGRGEEEGGLEGALNVVKTVHDGLVLLPSVVFHICIVFIYNIICQEETEAEN